MLSLSQRHFYLLLKVFQQNTCIYSNLFKKIGINFLKKKKLLPMTVNCRDNHIKIRHIFIIFELF